MKGYYNKLELYKRGWTNFSISRFLVTHDHEQYNHAYSSAPTIKLYEMYRVEQWEQTGQFKEWLIQKNKRKEAYDKGINNRHDRLLNKVNDSKFTILSLPIEQVFKNAKNAYNKNNGRFEPIDDQDFLDMLAVSWLRQNIDKYESPLKTGYQAKNEHLSLELDRKIYEEIAHAYPGLKPECDNQLSQILHCSTYKDH